MCEVDKLQTKGKTKPASQRYKKEKINLYVMLPRRLCKQTYTKRSGWLAILLMWKISSLLCGMLHLRRAGKGGRQRGRNNKNGRVVLPKRAICDPER